MFLFAWTYSKLIIKPIIKHWYYFELHITGYSRFSKNDVFILYKPNNCTC